MIDIDLIVTRALALQERERAKGVTVTAADAVREVTEAMEAATVASFSETPEGIARAAVTYQNEMAEKGAAVRASDAVRHIIRQMRARAGLVRCGDRVF